MKEVYNLYLPSNSKVSGDNYKATYAVNWYSFLPQKYNKFRGKMLFRTNPFSDGASLTPTIPNAMVFGDIPLPNNSCTLLSGGRSNCLGIAHTHWINGNGSIANQYYYLETPEIGSEFTCCYPQNNSLTIQLTTLAGVQHTTLLDSVNYTIILSFEGIDEE